MKKQSSGWELMFIVVKECRWCDGTSHHALYEDDTVHVCSSCGAEWEPVQVKYTPEELGMEDLDEEDEDWSEEDDYLQDELEREWARWDNEEKTR